MRNIPRPQSLILIAILLLTGIMSQKANSGVRANAAKEPSVPVKKQRAPQIRFVVGMSKPTSHLLEVEMHLKWESMPDLTQLKMPVWTPGSYLVREYARHVQDLAVRDASGKELAWEKINKNTWQVNSKGHKEFTVTYKVYSNELTVRTNELNDEHAFWNNAALLFFVKDHLKVPSTITVKPFGSWKIATGLPPVEGEANTFRAADFDVLYDSPFEVSDFKEVTFTVQGKVHRFVVTGEGNYDLRAIARDSAKIAEECYKIFGDLPFDNYLYILNLRGRGGLEHLNSTALQWNRFNFKPRSQYISFLYLVAHEYFHVWNVKRIRPDALGPFDYENENYTKLLWFAEGTTAYYEAVLLRRAGLITDKQFLATKASLITDLQARPGRFQTSLEEASFDAWIKYYRQDENSVNNQISYYDKGEIVNMMLDIEIRTASKGARSLDDVLRHLYNEFSKKGKNFPPTDLQRACEKMAGKSLDDFFAKYVRGRDEIDYDAIVGGVGLRMDASRSDEGKAYIGADLVEDAGRLSIRAVRSGTPAFEQGLNSGDQIIAVDGYRANLSFLNSYLADRKPGDTVVLSIFRSDRLREIEFKLGSDTRTSYSFEDLSNATSTQKRLYKEYLLAEL